MLVLTRKIGETVLIGNNVSVRILGLHGNRIQIGIDAPKDIPVHREELVHRLRASGTGQSVGQS